MSDHLLWRDGHKIFGCEQPKRQTPDEIFEEFKMKMKPHQCPPILHGDCKNAINDYLNMTRQIVNQRTGETAACSDVAASFAVFTGLMNVAAYASSAISNGSGEIAEALNRLARAIETNSPAADPPTLTRLRDVSRRIGITSESVMKLSRRGEFPEAVYLDDSGIPFFREIDVTNWLAGKAA